MFDGPVRVVPGELTARYRAEGWWTDESLGDLLAAGLAAMPEQMFRVHSAERPFAAPMHEVEHTARRLAAGLRERGVGAGDVVAFQLPNWSEAAAVFWGAALLGAVVVPIVHFYGPAELGYILATTRPRVFVTAERFGRTVFRPDLAAGVPVVAVVGADFDDLLADAPLTGVAEVDPAGPALIAFTSGTTRKPKGVVHSHHSLGFETRQLLAYYPAEPARQLTALPVGHFIGMVGAFLVPVLQRAPIDLLDAWNPERVLALMDSDGICIGGGPTYFVTSLLDHPGFRPDHLRFIPHIGLGGSVVPGAVTRRLTELGVTVTRSYGSTEHPSVTGSYRDAPREKRLHTDGAARPGVELRLAPDGEIHSRGPDLCLGYTDPALTAAAFDADGWYHTGDIGSLDADGYLTITDRRADLIIRGGENVSALEVEEVLLGLPGVAEAIAVAAPHPRFGEQVAAVLRMRPDAPAPPLPAIREHFAAAGLARPKWPELVVEVADFPRTASGKIQKYLVRDRLRAEKNWTGSDPDC